MNNEKIRKKNLQSQIDELAKTVGVLSAGFDKLSQFQTSIAESQSNMTESVSALLHVNETIQDPLRRLINADITNVQQIAVSQIEMLAIYHGCNSETVSKNVLK